MWRDSYFLAESLQWQIYGNETESLLSLMMSTGNLWENVNFSLCIVTFPGFSSPILSPLFAMFSPKSDLQSFIISNYGITSWKFIPRYLDCLTNVSVPDCKLGYLNLMLHVTLHAWLDFHLNLN